MTIIIDTLKNTGKQVNTIYQIDALAELAGNTGTIYIKEPSLTVLDQLNKYRKQYKLVYKIK
jgi:hypothetical protein